MSYDFKSVPKFIIKEASSGPIDVIDCGDYFTLYSNGDRWMVYNKDKDLEIKEMYSSYDLAHGDVLISGLGFGILALWLCNKPEVNSVTVVELSEDVVKIFKESNNIPEKLNIIIDNMITYTTEKEYDVLLLDHYEMQNYDWRLKDMEKICSRIKHKYFWAWSLEAIYLYSMYTNKSDKKEPYLVGNEESLHQVLDKIYNEFGNDLSIHWDSFVDKFLHKEMLLKNITGEKLNSYISTCFNR
jgi:hypothetical protein